MSIVCGAQRERRSVATRREERSDEKGAKREEERSDEKRRKGHERSENALDAGAERQAASERSER